ncbi:hypothetical protein [Poriferisphaera sp. WC338]|uniref:hypothetical protein n=1 Tax=Poriferisphaera sp. WC338 TaxID=3425129 RepID=UPI003D81989C
MSEVIVDKVFLEQVKTGVVDKETFASVELTEAGLKCAARDIEEAWYEVRTDDSAITVGLYTKDRWLSESIEADLMHSGDKMEELLEEELVELAAAKTIYSIDHFRDDQMCYVFVSQADSNAPPAEIATLLRGFEACFRQLGDMEGEED